MAPRQPDLMTVTTDPARLTQQRHVITALADGTVTPADSGGCQAGATVVLVGCRRAQP